MGNDVRNSKSNFLKFFLLATNVSISSLKISLAKQLNCAYNQNPFAY